MKLIVGLGNPGEKYAKTKHNVGYWVLDLLAEKLALSFDQKTENGIYVKQPDFILAKPTTFMNKSGDFVEELIKFYKINTQDLMIIYDDMNFEVGQAAIKTTGSAGGQRGMAHIIEKCKTKEIKRLKIGISRGENAKEYVLSPFLPKDNAKIKLVIEEAANILIFYLSNSFITTIEKFNANKNKV
ncbi:aminoacyl-tRNA hydrolase [Mesomycoplasma hyopneumoniae]|uniref:Peptidyl-tRNA hydrolase n=6 Tax=Mesomycoplasma hyopneumoniae TaxID=2099 RepID=PTH_MESH2|nr:aminoacyl-tRNA hydrolase [Mesomycoplasma hyopneumoniae]Q4AAD0.1 RecName: Full=Peptidyl-tRNA hydrolase; Short=PTH [Mesomycoplasma hyopneumoniae J]Q601M5.1 RecName: Full=Peptidyl-tRNA hydrolase; Short=PTH [Mesomycoplasma hyopneumoniae 232]AAV27758.1 peptidyl-tRNA hydrolase [Mesomycoplasma hyopneumoniae 232]AAZ44291.1 peptidyl-tRNA hydrolase [Mesomycoplasma hyopneumoniae J]ADQ90416.2 Peptidyl-tRNA hydrolase [Mesomycoplasma hyopneumoniae 168]AGM21984.1 Peptidyl-tRNA hydrolase [Mesomycoplasma h